MTRRSKARQVCLQMLYQVDMNADIDADTVRAQIVEQFPEDEDLSRFCWQLFAGAMEFRKALDETIQTVAENWSLSRMAPTDRNVLRLGAFEILHYDTPPRVAIDEAVELSRKFGTDQSPMFVNGILDKLIPDRDAGTP